MFWFDLSAVGVNKQKRKKGWAVGDADFLMNAQPWDESAQVPEHIWAAPASAL